MSVQRILDIDIFADPLYDGFLANFEKRLKQEAVSLPNCSDQSQDDVIKILATKNKPRLEQLLQEAAFEIIGPKIKFDRLGDAILSFFGFVLTHNRMPGIELTLNNVLFHIRTSNEILKPLRVFVTDKEFVKSYVSRIVGDKYNVSTFSVLKSKEEIEKYEFHDNCVIKPTHLSGEKIIPKNGDAIDLDKIRRWFDANYYYLTREANYAKLQPKVIIEEFLEDYYEIKVFCLNKNAKLVRVNTGGQLARTSDFFDTDWNELPILGLSPKSEKKLSRPDNLEEILDAAEKLSRNFNFVRIDFYTNGRDARVGEITNCEGGGLFVFRPDGAEALLSKLIFS